MRPIHAEGVARAVKRGKFLDCASNSASGGIPLDRRFRAVTWEIHKKHNIG